MLEPRDRVGRLQVLLVDPPQRVVAEEHDAEDEQAQAEEGERLPGAAVADDDRARLAVLAGGVEERTEAVLREVACLVRRLFRLATAHGSSSDRRRHLSGLPRGDPERAGGRT